MVSGSAVGQSRSERELPGLWQLPRASEGRGPLGDQTRWDLSTRESVRPGIVSLPGGTQGSHV